MNLNQSSCEVNVGIKNIEIQSESEILTSQESEKSDQTGTGAETSTSKSSGSSSDEELICPEPPTLGRRHRKKRPPKKKKTQAIAVVITTTAYEVPEPFMERYNEELQPPEFTSKAKRRRKRKHQKKSMKTTAYQTSEPFMKRYKIDEKPVKSISIPPKFHLRFDDEGNTDQKKSEFNLRSRIIKALKENLKLQNPEFKTEKLTIRPVKSVEPNIEVKISEKPRIVKANLIE